MGSDPSKFSLKSFRRSPLFQILLLATVFFFILLAVSLSLVFRHGPDFGGLGGLGRQGGFSFKGKSGVGVLEINGIILDSKVQLKQLRDFEEDDSVKAVVVRLNSPGGAVAPSQEIYEAVKAFPKPLVVSMGSVAASGAYYISCGAKKVFANPGTLTGSIGVIMDFVNLKELYQWAKIKRFSLKTGKFKGVGEDFREMTSEEQDLINRLLFDVLDQFKAAVVEGRNLSKNQVTQVADGRIFSGAQAKTLKLVDELGTFQDALMEAGKQAGLDGKPRIISPHKGRYEWIERILDQGEEESSSALAQFIQLFLPSRFIDGLLKRTPASSLPAVTDRSLTPGIYWLWDAA